MPRMRLLKCFVLQNSVIKTKHLKSLVRGVVQDFWGINLCLKKVGLRFRLGSNLTFFPGSVNLDFLPGSNLKISY